MSDEPNSQADRRDDPDDEQHLDPEPLAMDVEDIPKVFPEGETPAPPSTAQVQSP